MEYFEVSLTEYMLIVLTKKWRIVYGAINWQCNTSQCKWETLLQGPVDSSPPWCTWNSVTSEQPDYYALIPVGRLRSGTQVPFSPMAITALTNGCSSIEIMLIVFGEVQKYIIPLSNDPERVYMISPDCFHAF